MKTDKPFWETDINPVLGYRYESWDFTDERTLKIQKRWKPSECVIINEDIV